MANLTTAAPWQGGRQGINNRVAMCQPQASGDDKRIAIWPARRCLAGGAQQRLIGFSAQSYPAREDRGRTDNPTKGDIRSRRQCSTMQSKTVARDTPGKLHIPNRPWRSNARLGLYVPAVVLAASVNDMKPRSQAFAPAPKRQNTRPTSILKRTHARRNLHRNCAWG